MKIKIKKDPFYPQHFVKCVGGKIFKDIVIWNCDGIYSGGFVIKDSCYIGALSSRDDGTLNDWIEDCDRASKIYKNAAQELRKAYKEAKKLLKKAKIND